MEFTRVNRTTAPEAVAPATETVPPSRRGRRPFTVRRLAPYGYLSPTALLIIVLMVIPIVMVASYSFKDNAIVEENPVFTGLANYTKVLTDSTFLVALKNTFIFISLSTVAHLILGLVFAMLLNTPLLSGVTKAIFRIVYILPWLFTIAVIAVIWRLLLDPAGVVNYILTVVGLAQHGVNWLSSPNTALWALTFINIWCGYPFFMISILAGLQGIPNDLYEAASVDGANAFQRFRNVTIPQLAPVLISMAVLDLIWTSQQFALIWMTTGGGPLNVTEMLSTYTYKQAFSDYEFSTASASAVIVLLLTMILAFFYVRRLQRER
ncbi:MAG: sugar ABC transporter permease [Actinobacteria bacterium]|nr:MAG: sugar ABC transporter permease [Actinomycetota bacterium]